MDLADRRCRQRPAVDAVSVDHFVGAGPGSISLTNPHGGLPRRTRSQQCRHLPPRARTCSYSASMVEASTCWTSARPRFGRMYHHGAAIVRDGDRRDRPDPLAPARPALDQLGDGPGRSRGAGHGPPAPGLRLDLLASPAGPLGLSRTWRLTRLFAAGDGRGRRRPAPAGRCGACGSRRHPWLVSPISPQKNDHGMTAEQAARTGWHLTCGSWCPWQDSNLQPAV